MRKILLLIATIFSIAMLLVLATGKYLNPYSVSRAESTSIHYEQKIVIGDITVSYPDDFGLAVRERQLTSEAAPPPCDLGFDYCMYYVGGIFDLERETAGIRFNKRVNLNDKDKCLSTTPLGSFDYKIRTLDKKAYTSSVWFPTEVASSTGYYSSELYRIYVGQTCYEVESRVSSPSYEDGKKIGSLVKTIMESISLTKTNDKIFFPQ
jgi:hypothetical protein